MAPLRRALLVGIDAADWRVFSPRLDGGRMPSLAALVERGSSGRLAPLDRAGGLVGWTTIVTGVPAWRHGVLAEDVPLPDGSGTRPPVPADRVRPAVWEEAAAAGCRIAVSGCEGGVPAGEVTSGEVPAWAEAIAFGASGGEDVLGGLLRAASASFEAELRAADAACATGAWDLACVRTAWFGVLVREFIRFAPPAGPGVPAARAAAFGGVVDAACRALDGWIGRLVAAAGEGATVVVVGERGTDLERWRSPAVLLGGGHALRDAPLPSMLVVAGPGVRPDSLRFGTVATDVATIVRDALGLEGASDAAPAAAALPDAPGGVGSDRVLALVQARDEAFARSAAVSGALDAAIAAARRMVARRPADAAAALLLSEFLIGAELSDEARAVLDACRAAQLEHGVSGPDDGWALGLGRSRALAAVGRGDEALAEADAAAGAGAPPADAAIARALAAEAAGNWQASERAVRAAIEVDATRRDAHVVLARALYRQERYADAAAAAREALGRAWADPDMHLLLGTALAADRRPGEAIAALEECLRLRPEHPAALRRLAAIHARQLGNIEAAQAFMARAMASGRHGRRPARG
jgi:tetratricopeptide (TPR) repeat protein